MSPPRRPPSVGGGGEDGWAEDGWPDQAPDDIPRVEVLSDADRPGAFMLLLDRVRQSYVDLDDPTYLDFEYMRWMAHVVDALRPGPLNVTHIGGGAGTLVRYISAQRPGSSHIVFEPDVELTELVRATLPFERTVRVRIRPVDGRAGLLGLREASADLIILDAFAGGRVPAELTTAECAAHLLRALGSAGVLLANVGDGGSLDYTRRVLATLGSVMARRAAITEKGVLAGRRYGNIVLAASSSPLPLDDLARGLAREPFPSHLRAGSELDRWVLGVKPFTDTDSSRSPEPPEASWRVAAQ